MANAKKDVLSLALANVKKTDIERESEGIKRAVSDNKHAWGNELHNANKAVDNAGDRIKSLASNVGASAAQCLEAARTLALAEANVVAITELMAVRF
tara:strand:+ start:1553 stop:1843 length:291 start_codon:yes stop_codon:yes gene_type:complete